MGETIKLSYFLKLFLKISLPKNERFALETIFCLNFIFKIQFYIFIRFSKVFSKMLLPKRPKL